MLYQIRTAEEQMAKLFSVSKPFSEHLIKWEDNELRDKYDHNCFEYSIQPTEDEFRKALEYQKKRQDTFIKLEGNEPLKNSFGLEAGVTFTMVLQKDKILGWKKNANTTFRKPSLVELEKIEEKHFGAIYGSDFTIRNVRRLYEKLDYQGAYLNGRLVGSCYSWTYEGCTCIDGLIVDLDYRHQYVAASLLANVIERAGGNIIFLHADAEDTPKDMYHNMGFEITDRLYEYTCTDIYCPGH